MTEAELAQKFISYFGEFECYPEVPLRSGTCDFVVKAEPIYIAVEVKKTFSLDVIEQAHNHLKYSNYSYVAVPKAKNRRYFSEYICRDYGIGILEYCEKTNSVSCVLKAKLNRKAPKPELKEWMKESVAGTQHVRMTGFKAFVREVYTYLEDRKTPPSFQEVFDNIDKYYKKLSSFKSCLYQYTTRGVIKHITIDNGKLILDREAYKVQKAVDYEKYKKDRKGYANEDLMYYYR